MTGAVHETDVPQQPELARTAQPVAGVHSLFFAGRGPVAWGTRTFSTVALVNLGVGVPVEESCRSLLSQWIN